MAYTKIKEVLDSKGLKQEWVADQIGVTQATISNWCTGRKKPRKPSLMALANLLNVEIEDLK